MNSIKKLLAAALCLCLLLSLASCQKTEPVATTPDVTEVPTVTEAPAATEVPAPTEAPAPAESAYGFDMTEVVAKVNGQDVTWALAESYYNDYMVNYSSYYDMTAQENVDTFRAVALENAIYETILMSKATEMGLYPLTEEELAANVAEADAIWDENVAYYVNNMGDLTDESTEEEKAAAIETAEAYYAEMGYTRQTIRDNYLKSMVLGRLHDEVTKDVTITDAEVEADYQARVEADKALYENDIDAYIAYNSEVDMNNMYAMYYGNGEAMDYAWYRPAGFRGVKHILLSVDESLMQEYLSLQAQLEEQMTAEPEETTDAAAETAETAETTDATAESAAPATPVTQADVDNAMNAILAANQAKIDEINQRLANGEDFEALIPEYTVDSANLYEVSVASTNFVPEFVEAAFSVDNVGDVSAPYVSQFGIHIVKYMSDIPAGPIEMTEEQRQAKYESLLSALKDDLYSKTVEEWKTNAVVEYTGSVMSYEELLAQTIAEEEAASTEEAATEETATEEPATEEPAADEPATEPEVTAVPDATPAE